MKKDEFASLAKWLRNFFDNCSMTYEPSEEDFDRMARHYALGIDSWASSSALQEGRDLDDLT